MLILDGIANVLAFLGFMVGLWRWKHLDTSKRLLVAFLAASSLCGLGQTVLKDFDLTTAWFGNLWDLSILVLLIPACMMVMRISLRNPFKPLQILAVGVWIVVNIAMGGIPHFDDLVSMSFYGLLALVGAALFSQFIDDPLEPFRKPEFILALVALAAGSVDAITSLALSHYEAMHPGLLIGMMITRNAVWCGAYALLAYSLLLKGDRSESKSSLHRRRDDLQRDSLEARNRQHPFRSPDLKPHSALQHPSGAS